jgi:hypothetical protein
MLNISQNIRKSNSDSVLCAIHCVHYYYNRIFFIYTNCTSWPVTYAKWQKLYYLKNTLWLEAGIAEPGGKVVASQRLDKHICMATDNWETERAIEMSVMSESCIHELIVSQSPFIKDMNKEVEELQCWDPLLGNDWLQDRKFYVCCSTVICRVCRLVKLL